MRVAFLASGLEPGRDGVGDFARTLAAGCTALGHETRLAALRDPFRQKSAPNSPTSILEPRFRDIFTHSDENLALKTWLADFQPDWVSVHYTPFGFHRRGLGGAYAGQLHRLLPAHARRHLFLHEIWLQPGSEGLWRHRALGWFQRSSVDAWTTTGWRPHVVHTQARLHQARLRKRGVPAEILPLCTPFSNPHVSIDNAREQVAALLRSSGSYAPAPDENAWWIGHFGSLYREGWDFPTFAAKIAGLAGLMGKKVCFFALGRARAAAEVWAQAARAVPQADFRVIGELPPEKITVAMQACDAAITSTPWDIIEKSSSVAAWRALGIPVLVTRGPAPHNGRLPAWPDHGLLPAFGADPNFALPFARVPPPAFLAPEATAHAFLSALTEVHSPRA